MDRLVWGVQKEKQQGKPSQKVQAWKDIVSKNHEGGDWEFPVKCQRFEVGKNRKNKEF